MTTGPGDLVWDRTEREVVLDISHSRTVLSSETTIGDVNQITSSSY